jgi:fatty-acyl-CoA synthase
MSRQDAAAARSLKAWMRALERTAPLERQPLRTLPLVIDELAVRFGAAPALTSAQERMSYTELAARANQYAHWAMAQDLRSGDVVCLLMPNCPEYLAAWLGISRVGIAVALLNTNLTGSLLAHSIRIVAPKHLIAHERLASALDVDEMPRELIRWVHGAASGGFRALGAELARQSDGAPDMRNRQQVTLTDRALYIYTSGTTGHPKAASISHLRVLQWSHWFAGLMDTGPDDRMYDCLPLYHSVGGIVATGATLLGGGTVVLRDRFSLRDFWHDIAEEKCTLFQYVGELCRYLVNAPSRPVEATHRLRLCCGNGLRADVWERFQSRFRIPQILEYYAATEGTFALYNCEGKPGAIGRIPAFLAHRLPIALARFDVDSAQPWRGSDGFCERVAVGEPGEALGLIASLGDDFGGRFEGYADADASSQKILRDVFKHGDAWYRTGDLMRQDSRGFYYFVDRVGDTYRWKGQNVSTTEVAETIAACDGVEQAVVYGVAVPGADGRVGMAAIVTGPKFDVQELRRQLTERLPEYARPAFLRILGSLEHTGTFKPRVQQLVHQGYDPIAVSDALFVDDRGSGHYTALDDAGYARLLAGDFRL